MERQFQIFAPLNTNTQLYASVCILYFLERTPPRMITPHKNERPPRINAPSLDVFNYSTTARFESRPLEQDGPPLGHDCSIHTYTKINPYSSYLHFPTRLDCRFCPSNNHNWMRTQILKITNNILFKLPHKK